MREVASPAASDQRSYQKRKSLMINDQFVDESDSEESEEVPRQKEFPTEAAVGTAVALNSLRANAEI